RGARRPAQVIQAIARADRSAKRRQVRDDVCRSSIVLGRERWTSGRRASEQDSGNQESRVHTFHRSLPLIDVRRFVNTVLGARIDSLSDSLDELDLQNPSATRIAAVMRNAMAQLAARGMRADVDTGGPVPYAPLRSLRRPGRRRS